MGRQLFRRAQKIDSIDYWSLEVEKYGNMIDAWRSDSVHHKPCGLAFVTFASPIDAHHFVLETKSKKFALPGNSIFNPSVWKVSRAPDPLDILWENISLPRSRLWVTRCFSFLLIFVLLLLCTIPTVFLSTVDNFMDSPYNNDQFFTPIWKVFHFSENSSLTAFLDDALFAYLPTVLLFILAFFTLMLVTASSQWEKYRLKSLRDAASMKKAFVYLILLIVVIPGLILLFLDGFENHLDFPDWDRYEIVMHAKLMDLGSFFVNFTLTAALVGNSWELLRISDRVKARWASFRQSTQREVIELKMESPDFVQISPGKGGSYSSPFNYGTQYAWVTSVFAVVIVYSAFVPLILPCGLLFFVIKYVVDKFHLCFVCPVVIQMDSKIVGRGVTFFGASVVIFQCLMFTFYVAKQLWAPGWTCFGVTIIGAIIYIILTIRRNRFHNQRTKRMKSIYEHQKLLRSPEGGEGNEENKAEEVKSRKLYVHSLISTNRNNNIVVNDNFNKATQSKTSSFHSTEQNEVLSSEKSSSNRSSTKEEKEEGRGPLITLDLS